MNLTLLESMIGFWFIFCAEPVLVTPALLISVLENETFVTTLAPSYELGSQHE